MKYYRIKNTNDAIDLARETEDSIYNLQQSLLKERSKISKKAVNKLGLDKTRIGSALSSDKESVSTRKRKLKHYIIQEALK